MKGGLGVLSAPDVDQVASRSRAQPIELGKALHRFDVELRDAGGIVGRAQLFELVEENSSGALANRLFEDPHASALVTCEGGRSRPL
jgi:hypothetical protein